MAKFLGILALLSFLLLSSFGYKGESGGNREQEESPPKASTENPKQIVLLGASIGRSWRIPELPQRLGNRDYVFEYLGSSFDKTNNLRTVLSREDNKPDAVIIKECAAYFPGDLEHYKAKMKEWIDECRQKDVIPIPATVVPVTRLHSYKVFVGYLFKGRNPWQFGCPLAQKRNKAILKFNDWIRDYCGSQRMVYLDLEASLCYSPKNRYLRENLARLDGLHINSKAYAILDQDMIRTLERIDWESQGHSQ